MQYLEHILFGVALLIFVGVAALVGLAVLVKVTRGPKPGRNPTIYPIPPAERGTGLHRSLLDLVDEHIVTEELARRRKRFSDKLFDFVQDQSPKA